MILMAIVNFAIAKIIAKVHTLSLQCAALLTNHVRLPRIARRPAGTGLRVGGRGRGIEWRPTGNGSCSGRQGRGIARWPTGMGSPGGEWDRPAASRDRDRRQHRPGDDVRQQMARRLTEVCAEPMGAGRYFIT